MEQVTEEITEVQAIAIRIAKRQAELAELESQYKAMLAVERPNAMRQARELIALYNLSPSELGFGARVRTGKRRPRSDAGIPRGPRKAAAQADPPATPPAPAPVSGFLPPIVHEYA